jgi:Protein of unknown function (DUF3071)
MRALRVVGIAEDGHVVLEDSGRRERYTVAADEQLRAAARGDLARLGQITIELESQLRPREIQARIRAGASVEQVAAAAGVPSQKIERFAYPVLLERSRTAEVAQRAHPMRADGPDVRMLGDVVAHTFGLRGLEYTEAEWDSWKGEDGKWVIALSWRAGRSDNRAHWTFHPGAHGGNVAALDEHASDLVEGQPARPLRTVGPVIDIARQEESTPSTPPEELRAASSDTTRGGERIDAAMRGAAGMRNQPGARPPEQRLAPPAQRQAEPRRPEARASEAGTAETRTSETRAPDVRGTDTRTPEHRAAELERAHTPPDERAMEGQPRGARHDEQAPPVGSEAAPVHDPATDQPVPEAAAADSSPAGSRRTRKGKPVMPSWDEVLLGVRGQR